MIEGECSLQTRFPTTSSNGRELLLFHPASPELRFGFEIRFAVAMHATS
jgi:hypothetical protein